MAKYFFLVLALIGTLVSCKKKDINLDEVGVEEDLTPSFAWPIGFVDLTLSDIEQQLDDDFVFNENSQLFEIVVSEDVFEIEAGELLDIPQQQFQLAVVVPAEEEAIFGAGGAGTVVDFNQTLEDQFILPNGALLDSILVENGTMTFSISSEFLHDIQVDMEFPYITQNGQPVSFTLDMPWQGGSLTEGEVTVDLTGHVIDLSQDGATENALTLNTTVVLTHTGQAVDGTEEISATGSISLDSFDEVWGYFGNLVLQGQDEVALIPFFSDLNEGVLSVADPRLELSIFNTTGIPVQSTERRN